MENSAKNISKAKFQKLSLRQQHRILAGLASDSLRAGGCEDFWQRYAMLHGLTHLDRYYPAKWLSQEEALTACRDFHLLFGEIPQPISQPKPQLWQPRYRVEVILDQVKTPYNIGSILRLIDNFGFAGLVHASPWLRWDHPRLARAARGCQGWIPVSYQADLPEYLAQMKRPVFAIEACDNAVDLEDWEPPPECAFVLGNESYGVSRAILDQCDGALRIPMHGFKHSMNVSHAFAVVGHYWLNHQPLPCEFERSSS